MKLINRQEQNFNGRNKIRKYKKVKILETLCFGPI